jgi:hypothetical protein
MLKRDVNTIIIRAYLQLGDNALQIARNDKNGNTTGIKQRKLWAESAMIRVLLKNLEFRERQDYKVSNKFLSCLVNLSNINDYPAAPTLFTKIKPSVILPSGPAGPTGPAGTDGTDADIDVEADATYDNIAVTEVDVMGVKTYRLGYAPYTEPTISVSVNTGAITAPQSVYREEGESLTIPLTVVLTKGREAVTASTFQAPGAMNGAYQGLLDLPTLNTNGTDTISISQLSVIIDTTYTIDITDATETNDNSANVYFNYPILYGNSAGTSITYYSALTKLTRTDGGIQTVSTGRSVTFNGADQYFWFGFHNGEGTITQILDGSGFDVTADFTELTLESVTATGLASNWTENYTFYRTTNVTSISSKTYTFNK